MPRLSRPIDASQALAKSTQARLRRFYKAQTPSLPPRARAPQLYQSLGVSDEASAYAAMAELYNENVRTKNDELAPARAAHRDEARQARNKKARDARAEKKARPAVVEVKEEPVRFIAHLTLHASYYEKYYDTDLQRAFHAGDEFDYKLSDEQDTALPSEIKDLLYKKFDNKDDGYKITTIVSYTVEVMDTAQFEGSTRPPRAHTMTRAYVLRNDWLNHAHGIAEHAYENSDGRCVYAQLTALLLDPPTGRPTKFIANRKTSEDALFSFFEQTITTQEWGDRYPEFSVDTGVSSELIAELCKATKRNMYAYDASDRVFDSVMNQSSHYCPVVFYKLHGHMYLIDNPETIRSVAESNKKKGTKIVSVSITDDKERPISEVFQLEKFNAADAPTMVEEVYLLNQSSLDKEIVEFITTHSHTPETKTRKSSVVQFRFQVGLQNVYDRKDRKYVVVCVDATYAERYGYDDIKRVADHNRIPYTNEGIGSLIMSILAKGSRSCREYLNGDERAALCAQYNNLCALCSLPADKFEIDHIHPIAGGGSNSIGNLQPLCFSCHRAKSADERQLGEYKPRDTETSVFNKVALENLITKPEYRAWQFVERVAEPSTNPAFKIDMRKCRRNLTYHSKYDFPVYNVMDIPRPFSGTITCGTYYVESTNDFPLRGSGWYSQPLVEYTLARNIIQLDDIKYEFLPSNTLPAEYFRKPIDTLLDAFAVEPTMQKLSVNSLIGLFGRTKHSASKVKFTLCHQEASEWWADEKESKADVFIRNIKLDNGETLYEGIFSESVEVEGLKYPLYKQILEMEAVELHTLERIIRNGGGTILDRNTDAIRYERRTKLCTDGYYWDDAQTILKYQTEDPKPLENEVLPRMIRPRIDDFSAFDLPWDVQNDYEGSAEAEAATLIDSGTSMHIDGRGGTGKTYLLNCIQAELTKRGLKYTAFSPTNKGARLIAGNTIHSLYYKYQSNRRKLFSIMEKIDYIFIDEISMMVVEFYQLFTLIKRSFPNMKFIIAGDFAQLAPVKDSWDGDYKNSAALNVLCDGRRVQLTTCRRADARLFELCGDVSKVRPEEFAATTPTYKNLAYCHDTRIKVNRDCMRRFLDEFGSAPVAIPHNPKNPKTQDVLLTKGMPVIAHTTSKKLGILNSQTFKITNLNASSITVSDGGEPIKICTDDFHKFFYLGFCITIHASQGETYSDPYTIYDWRHPRFCERARYVALSRGTSIHNIQIRQ